MFQYGPHNLAKKIFIVLFMFQYGHHNLAKQIFIVLFMFQDGHHNFATAKKDFQNTLYGKSNRGESNTKIV